MTTQPNPFLIHGDRLLRFIDAVLAIDLINDPDQLKPGRYNPSGLSVEMPDSLMIAKLVSAQKEWHDPALSGVFPLPAAIFDALHWFRAFLAVNAPELAETELSAAPILNWLVFPTREDIEENVQRVHTAEPLLQFFNRFASGELSW